MKTKYYNDNIIGNKEMLASISKKGELLRLYYPTPDNRQYIDFFETGVKINDSLIIYNHNDVNNIYSQKYIEDTNVLETQIKNTYFNLKIVQTDFVSINENVLIKRYVFKNENEIDLDVKFLIHSKLHSGENNLVSAKVTKNGLIQYTHDYSLNIMAIKEKLYSHQINDSSKNIYTGIIEDKDYIGMSQDSSICYNIGKLKPNEKKTLDIIIYFGEENQNKIKKIDLNKEQANTISYWKKYYKKHNTIKLPDPQNSFDEKLTKIYKRSIMLFPLLSNEKTGGIIAAVEVDEEKNKCGRYGYCWPRDAAFIAQGLDILKMNSQVEKFYKTFCKNTQSSNGMWEQRFYTDGKLAPCWGYQIDETASVIYGVYNHYKYTKDKQFLKDTLPMCEKGVKFLNKYIEDIMQNKNELQISYDLWEMCEGIHLYSLSAIYGAYEAMEQIYDEVYEDYKENKLKQQKIEKEKIEYQNKKTQIKKYILKNMYDENKKTFIRNAKDRKLDISILGAITPYKVFMTKEKEVINTIENIDLSLRTYTGGYKRFEEDTYMNGNPWTIATLWMAWYKIEKGETNKARELLNYIVKTSAENGLIAEQIDNQTLKPIWVLGLGWAHAMFIIVLEKLYGKK